jgi:hypothetical protein
MLRGVRKAEELTPHNEPKINTTRALNANAQRESAIAVNNRMVRPSTNPVEASLN